MIQAALDLPTAADTYDPLTLPVQGWIFAGERQAAVAAVEAVIDGTPIGRTALLYRRPDVARALGIPADTATGFSLLGTAPALVPAQQARLVLQVVFADGARETIAAAEVTLSRRDYRAGDWGILVDPAFPHLVRREHMYNSGPSQDTPSADLLSLLERYLPPAPARILDVGCGRGPYAAPLRDRGYEWLGVELKPEDCAVLRDKGLPYRQVDGQTLPFAAADFEAALCVEVLEHVENPWNFIAEVRRVVRQRLIISVPNLELVPYWRPHLAVPWHLLEADHRNFFSRASLRELLKPHFRSVEVLSYGEAPLRSTEGVRLDYHLLAVASVG